MAPSHEENHLAKGVMVYAGQIVEKKSSRLDKKIARSSGFKSLVLYLSEREPSGMDGLLKSASRKCCHALGMEKGSQIARKRAAPSNSNERDAKRNKITHSSEEATAPSQQITKSELIAQVCDHKTLSQRHLDTNSLNPRDTLKNRISKKHGWRFKATQRVPKATHSVLRWPFYTLQLQRRIGRSRTRTRRKDTST